MSFDDLRVIPIAARRCHPLILNHHYARRLPSIMYSFGLIRGTNELLGCVAYGSPPSPNLTSPWGVVELNRLVLLDNHKNYATYMIAQSLQQLPPDTLIISYADTALGHVGYVYQASNWLYTGSHTAHDCEYVINGRKTHTKTLCNRGITAPKQWAVENGIEWITPKPKHRYFYPIASSKKIRKEMIRWIDEKYGIIKQYPKATEKAHYNMTDFALPDKGGFDF